jgi:Na+/H+-dicarboxylate symporter
MVNELIIVLFLTALVLVAVILIIFIPLMRYFKLIEAVLKRVDDTMSLQSSINLLTITIQELQDELRKRNN